MICARNLMIYWNRIDFFQPNILPKVHVLKKRICLDRVKNTRSSGASDLQADDPSSRSSVYFRVKIQTGDNKYNFSGIDSLTIF